MPDHLASFKLDFFTPESFGKIVKKAAQDGISVKGRHGTYINYHMGDMLLIIRTATDPKNGLDYITGFDSHAKGCCVWDCVIVSEQAQDDITAKTVFIDSNGAPLPLPLVNGDILASYAPGSPFKAQVAAYPSELSLYGGAEGAQAAGKVNAIVPHNDNTVTIWGQALGFREGQTAYMGGVMTKFLIGLVATDQGELEVVFPGDLVKEEEEELLRPGSWLCCRGELAGNPAILDLEKGVTTPEESK